MVKLNQGMDKPHYMLCDTYTTLMDQFSVEHGKALIVEVPHVSVHLLVLLSQLAGRELAVDPGQP